MLTSRISTWLACLLSANVLLASHSAVAAAVSLRTVSQEANTLKFDQSNKQKPGLSIDVMHALERIDPDLHFMGLENTYPTKRIESALGQNELDVFFGLLKSPERERHMRFIESPVLYQQRDQIAVNSDDSVNVAGFDDIRRLKTNGVIGVPQGSAYIDYLKKQSGLIVDDGTVSVVNTLKN
jgi:glutamate/aspartate transport system substrate-binding protein